MAADRSDSDIDAILVNEEDVEKALCVLAGSDPDNCSYSRVRKASCTKPNPAGWHVVLCVCGSFCHFVLSPVSRCTVVFLYQRIICSSFVF